ncbi:MAG: DUF6249 domain-containing protein [Pseudomonadota bacterium]
MGEIATGLGVLGFWLFIAAIIVTAIWSESKRKESQQETLRRVVESGQTIDPEVFDRMLGKSDAAKQASDLKVAGLITSSVGVGFLVFGLFLGTFDWKSMFAMIGVSAMIGCIGGGLLLAARLVGRRTAER